MENGLKTHFERSFPSAVELSTAFSINSPVRFAAPGSKL